MNAKNAQPKAFFPPTTRYQPPPMPRSRGRLRRDWIDIPAFLKSEGFTWRGPGPWVDLGLCPFHKDTRPSLRANLETGRLRCMSCGFSGDLVAYVQHRHGLSFVGAAGILGAWEVVG